jgi:hypothetical protein
MPATTSVKRAMEQSLQKAVKAAAKRPVHEWDHKSLMVAGACLVAGLLMALLVKYLSARAAAAAADDEHELQQLASRDGHTNTSAAAPRAEAEGKAKAKGKSMPPFERVRRLKRLQSKQAYRMQLVRNKLAMQQLLMDRIDGELRRSEGALQQEGGRGSNRPGGNGNGNGDGNGNGNSDGNRA